MLFTVPCLAKSPLNLLAHTNRHLPYNLDSPYISTDSLSIRFNGIYAWGTGVDDTMFMKARGEDKYDYFVGIPPGAGLYSIMWNSQYYKLEACEGDTIMKPQNNWQVPSYWVQEKGYIDSDTSGTPESNQSTWGTSWFVNDSGLVLNGLVDSIPWGFEFFDPENANTILNQANIIGKKCLDYVGEDTLYIGLRVKVDSLSLIPQWTPKTVICSLRVAFIQVLCDSIRDSIAGDDTIPQYYNSTDTIYSNSITVLAEAVETLADWGEYFTKTVAIHIDDPCNFLCWWDTTACTPAGLEKEVQPYWFHLPLYSGGNADFWVDYVEVYNAYYDSLKNGLYDSRIQLLQK